MIPQVNKLKIKKTAKNRAMDATILAVFLLFYIECDTIRGYSHTAISTLFFF